MVKSYSKADLEMTLFDHMAGINDMEPEQMDCKIYDGDAGEEITYRSLKEKR